MRRHLQDDREDSRRRRGKHTQGRDGRGRGGGVRKAARRGQAVRSGTPQAPLAEGWYEAWDENLGRPYYFRYDPDQSVWDRRLATAPEVVDSGSSAHADEVRGHEPVLSNEPSTPRVLNESMTHATSPGWNAVVQANSPAPSPTSEIFAQPTHLNPLAPGAGSSGSRILQSDTPTSESQASIAPSTSCNKKRPAIEEGRQALADLRASDAPFGPSIRSSMINETAIPVQGTQVLPMPRPNISRVALQSRSPPRLGQLGDSSLAADRPGLELPQDILRNVAWFLRGQQMRIEHDSQSSLPRDANGWMARFREVLPFAPVTSEGIISLIKWDDLQLQNAANTPCAVQAGQISVQTACARRSAPMQPGQTAENIGDQIAGTKND